MLEVVYVVFFLLPATLAATYYFGLTTLGRWPRRVHRPQTPMTTFTILVPAHNEELTLPRTLASLAALDYPRELYNVVVIADNCTDATARIASSVRVIERTSALRGKGYALADVLPTLTTDAVVIFDADGELDSETLNVFDAGFQAGREVIQGSIRTRNEGDGPTALVASVGNVLDDLVSAGRDRLGLKVPLRGSNMAFRRDVLARFPWQCHGVTEDAEYADVLHRAGVRIHFDGDAKARSESPADWAAMHGQRRRWKAALKLIDSKPLVLCHLIITTLLLVVLPSFAWLMATLWSMTFVVYLPAVTWNKSLIKVPATIIRLCKVALLPKANAWQRTKRTHESSLSTAH